MFRFLRKLRAYTGRLRRVVDPLRWTVRPSQRPSPAPGDRPGSLSAHHPRAEGRGRLRWTTASTSLAERSASLRRPARAPSPFPPSERERGMPVPGCGARRWRAVRSAPGTPLTRGRAVRPKYPAQRAVVEVLTDQDVRDDDAATQLLRLTEHLARLVPRPVAVLLLLPPSLLCHHATRSPRTLGTVTASLRSTRA